MNKGFWLVKDGRRVAAIRDKDGKIKVLTGKHAAEKPAPQVAKAATPAKETTENK
jgi:hypothetical protein